MKCLSSICLLRMQSTFSCKIFMLRRLFLGVCVGTFRGVLFCVLDGGVRWGGVGVCDGGVWFMAFKQIMHNLTTPIS